MKFGLKLGYEVEFEFNFEGFLNYFFLMFRFPPLLDGCVRGFLFLGGLKWNLYFCCFGAEWAIRAVLKISALLLKYPIYIWRFFSCCHVEKLKVRQSRNDFFKLMFLPKNEQMNATLLWWYLMLTCFCSYFGRNWWQQKDISVPKTCENNSKWRL